MAKKDDIKKSLFLNESGEVADYNNMLNQDHIEYDPIKVYSEKAPYSKTSKVSEVFGPRNENIIHGTIKRYVTAFDQFVAEGNKDMASVFESAVKKVHTQVQHLSNLKDEWMMMRGGGMRGKNTVSNITDPRWPDAFFTEKGEIIITPDHDLICGVPSLPHPPKYVNEIALDWESKGDGEGKYMAAISDMVDASSRGDSNPPFDVDYFTSNLLEEYWPQALSDKWGGVYALHDILPGMVEENGGTAEGLNLSIEAFNPSVDNRLHTYYADRLRKAFNPDYQTAREKAKSKNISAETSKPTQNPSLPEISSKFGRTSDSKLKDADILTRGTNRAINTARKEGRV